MISALFRFCNNNAAIFASMAQQTTPSFWSLGGSPSHNLDFTLAPQRMWGQRWHVTERYLPRIRISTYRCGDCFDGAGRAPRDEEMVSRQHLSKSMIGSMIGFETILKSVIGVCTCARGYAYAQVCNRPPARGQRPPSRGF